jgi:hypothetical protein
VLEDEAARDLLREAAGDGRMPGLAFLMSGIADHEPASRPCRMLSAHRALMHA